MEKVDYLEDHFKVQKVTTSRLRAILLECGIPYGNAKKSMLIRLFEEHIKPKIKTLREQRQAIRPSAAGIINAGSQDDFGYDVWSDEEDNPKKLRRSERLAKKARVNYKERV
jgi:hypothetical protein